MTNQGYKSNTSEMKICATFLNITQTLFSSGEQGVDAVNRMYTDIA